jgi:hypothetical protein
MGVSMTPYDDASFDGTHYRIYKLNGAGSIMDATDAVCGSDEDAREFAKASLPVGARAEVWSGTRFVGQVFVVR